MADKDIAAQFAELGIDVCVRLPMSGDFSKISEVTSNNIFLGCQVEKNAPYKYPQAGSPFGHQALQGDG